MGLRYLLEELYTSSIYIATAFAAQRGRVQKIEQGLPSALTCRGLRKSQHMGPFYPFGVGNLLRYNVIHKQDDRVTE
jgi:hypothetical protein